MLGWLAGAVVPAAMMGSLAQQLLDAVAGNPALANAIGASGGRPDDGLIAMTQLYLAIIGAGYVVRRSDRCAPRRPPGASSRASPAPSPARRG